MNVAPTNSTSARLRPGHTALLVVDFQERLLPAIHDREAVLANALRLARGAAVMHVPTFVTEQYPQGLGATNPDLAAAIPCFEPLEKTVFSALGAPGLEVALQAANVSDVMLCGIESHVCVYQSCMDLLARGLRVHVVADAVSSRTPENRQIGLDRMRAAGALVVSVEMALFDLLGDSAASEFKDILRLVK